MKFLKTKKINEGLIVNKPLSYRPVPNVSALLGCSERASERYVPTYSVPALQEEEYYQSEAEGLLDCHKCRYLCTGRGEPLGDPAEPFILQMA